MAWTIFLFFFLAPVAHLALCIEALILCRDCRVRFWDAAPRTYRSYHLAISLTFHCA